MSLKVLPFCMAALVSGSSVLLAQESAQPPAPQLPPLEKWAFPLAPAPATVPDINVEFEIEPTPAVKAWADAAKSLMQQWWPAVCRMLATENFQQPKQFKLRFQREQKVPGYRTGDGLYISMPWITQHPDDLGMIIHEMTHAIQDYRRTTRETVWIGEGIADYIRYWRYEPEKPKRKVDKEKASYKDGYNSTPSFFAWLIWKYDRRILHDLDGAMRAGTYNDEFFQKMTGKPLDELWKQFLSELPWCGVNPA